MIAILIIHPIHMKQNYVILVKKSKSTKNVKKNERNFVHCDDNPNHEKQFSPCLLKKNTLLFN